MIEEILQRIKETQALQDEEGADHPGEVQVYTFECPLLQRIMLKLRRIKGLEFEYYQGSWWGIYRAQK
jgi:hypothetical protein